MNYLKRCQDMIRLRGLTSNTVRSYSTYISAYLDYVSEHLNRRPSQVTWQQKRDFIEWIQRDRALSDRTVNTIISQLRFFTLYVLHKPWDPYQLPFRRFDQFVPFVPTRDEVAAFINSVDDLKARVMIILMYSSGLRVGEVFRLRYEDISRSNMKIHISRSKNRSDRYVHCIISGAGLTRDLKLRKCGSGFFIPIRAASKLFRGKFMAALKQYRASGELVLPPSFSDPAHPVNWQCLVDDLYDTDWCAYIKETFNGFGNAINYLGRYTHRVAISNARILQVTDDSVSFWYRDYKDGYVRKEMTLSHQEFIRRFLLHVLPKGFQKIRYFGFLANPVKKKKLKILFRLQGRRTFKARFSTDTPKDILLASLGIDVRTCPCCGKSAMRYIGRSFHARP